MSRISVIILAGGTGSRMQEKLPKQLLFLCGKRVLHYSIEQFLSLSEIEQIIVVLDRSYHQYCPYPVEFAPPGPKRQNSVANGLKQVDPKSEYVLVHDAARPLIKKSDIEQLLIAGKTYGAASLAVPIKTTVKEIKQGEFVAKTLDRDLIWEIQTPQMLKKNLLEEGLAKVFAENLEATDDVTLAELLMHPVKLIRGSYTNFKITVPEDLIIAETFLSKNG